MGEFDYYFLGIMGEISLGRTRNTHIGGQILIYIWIIRVEDNNLWSNKFYVHKILFFLPRPKII